MTRSALFAAFFLVCAAGQATARAASGETSREAQWVEAHALPVGVDSESVSPSERKAILKFARGVRVIGFGEFTHGSHEPLVARNRWIRVLVEEGAITAVALESGLAASRRVNEYILGGPGDAESVTRTGFNWTFETLRANVDLVRWLRTWNAAHPRRTIRLYGADISGGDTKSELGRAAVVIEEVRTYLADALPTEGPPLSARLDPYVDRFDQVSWHNMDGAERARVRALAGELAAAFDRNAKTMTARTGASRYAWARLMVEDIKRLTEIFEVWPVANPQDWPAQIAVVNLRDKAMADYVLWALKQEGPKGRLLLFAANGHVTKLGFDFTLPDGTKPNGQGQGWHLAQALGSRYRAVLTTSSGKAAEKKTLGELDKMLTTASGTPYLLSLAKASMWWRETRTITHGGARKSVGMNPALATDALLFLGPVTDAPVF